MIKIYFKSWSLGHYHPKQQKGCLHQMIKDYNYMYFDSKEGLPVSNTKKPAHYKHVNIERRQN